MMSFKESVKTCLTKKYFTIKGRATRAEYWWFQLFFVLMMVMVFGFAGWISSFALNGPNILTKTTGAFALIFFLLIFIPLLCVKIRRLHDVGGSGSLIFLALIPYIGFYIVEIICILPSENDDNGYGPNPRKKIKCSHCGEYVIPTQETYCHKCGIELTTEKKASENKQEVVHCEDKDINTTSANLINGSEEKQQKEEYAPLKCPHCGKSIYKLDSVYCKYCGKPVRPIR